MKLSYTASERDQGRKIYGILKGELRLSASQIKLLKTAGGITLDGNGAFTTQRVAAGQLVEADLTLSERPPEFPPEAGALDVIYDAGGLLAVNKPAGMLSHPSRSRYSGTLANLAAGYLLEYYSDPCCHLVNRLDRDTSGIVLFARNAHLKRLAALALAAEGSYKEYTAYLFGELNPDSGVIDLPITRQAPGLMRRIVSPEGQRAVTHYVTVGGWDICGVRVTCVRFRLETGRTHQIRVHSLASGAPILGDPMYCTPESLAFSQSMGLSAQLLHAGRLSFPDPMSGAQLDLTAPIVRDDMVTFSEKLRGKKY